MARRPASPAQGLIGVLFSDGAAASLSDDQLLARFVSQRDGAAELAFEALVRRHGSMVMGVCRSTLVDAHDAEDAFQATFLVLAQRASTLCDPAGLGPWLYGVALRTSRKLRGTRARRRRLEQRAEAGGREPDPIDQALARREDARVLHEEIGRLPEPYRAAITLCDLDGLTHSEAARRLGCPPGTVSVQLMRARERLRDRLTRRGVHLAGCLLPMMSPKDGAVPPLFARTARLAALVASGTAGSGAVPARVAAIAAGVSRTMSLKTIMFGSAALIGCTLLVAGSAALAVQKKAPPSKPPATPAAGAAKEEEARSIVVNGGFEHGRAGGDGPEGWKPGADVAGVSSGWDRTTAHEGQASLHFRKTVARYFPIAERNQRVKRTGTAPRLKVSAFVKASKMTKAILDVQFLDNKGDRSHAWAAYIGSKDAGDAPANHDWKRYEGVVAIPEGTTTLIIAPQVYGPGNVWFDDVTAEYTDAPATDPVAP